MAPTRIFKQNLGILSASAIAMSLTLWAGCSASGASSPGGSGGSGTAARGSGATAGAGATTGTGAVNGGGAVTGTTGGVFGFGGGVSTGGTDTGLPDGACGATTLVAEKVIETRIETRTEEVTRVTPAALYIMLDQSLSMGLSFAWVPAVDSLTTFVNDPASSGLHVGLQYFAQLLFPNDCSGASYGAPDVPWGVLGPPGTHNQAIIDSLAAHGPVGAGTPIEDALRGVIQGCKDYEAANPDIPCFALLVTDGDPTNCVEPAEDDNTSHYGYYASIAEQGASDGVPVYTVGMQGADLAFLDAIAGAAGTDCNGAASGLTCDAGQGAQFLDALNSVRETVTDVIVTEEEVEYEVTQPLDCEWVFPSGEDTDVDKVTVEFTDQATGSATELGRVTNPDDCANVNELAWHYDVEPDPATDATPTKLVACPSTCDTIKAADAKVDILAGCDVKIIVPR